MPFFVSLYRFCLRKKYLLTALALLLLTVCGLFSARLAVREDITALMPTEPPGLAEQFAVLREAPFLQGLSIAVGGDNPAQSAQVLSAALRSPEIPRVLSGPGQPFTPLSLTRLCRSIPGLMRADALAALLARLDEAPMRAALKRDRDLLIAPQGLVLREFLAMDPLSICSGVLQKLAPAAHSLGVRGENGLLLNAEGSHALVLAEPALSMADSQGAAKVMERVRAAVSELPPGTEAIVVGGHRHTEENADIIRKDVARILPVSILLLGLAFLIFVRTVNGLCILLLPTAALAAAAAFTGFLYGGLSGIVLGFGSVVLGITTDYAIHVYYALRSGTDAAESLNRVSGPLLLGAGTTLTGFAAFSLSSIPCIIQMTVFAISGVGAALVFALVLLPVWIAPGNPKSREPAPDQKKRLKRVPLAAVWLALGLCLAFLAYNTPVNGDIRSLSYLSPQTARDEQRLRELFGGLREQGVYAVKGKSLEEALRANDQVWEALGRTAPDQGWEPGDMVTSLAALLPAASTQKERAQAWRRFWDEQAGPTLSRLDSLAGETGFSAEAFTPFKEWIRAETVPITPELLVDIGMEVPLMLARPTGESWLVFSLVRAGTALPGLLPVLEENNGVYISGRSFRAAMDDSTRADLLRFGGLSFLAILGASAFFFRSPWRMAAALLPIASGLVCVLAFFQLTGLELNIFHAMALPLVISLSVDYGIFVLAHLEGKLGKETRKAVLLSGITTLSGFGVLLLARHPALHSIGVTVSLGLCAALAAALLLLPCFVKPEEKQGAANA